MPRLTAKSIGAFKCHIDRKIPYKIFVITSSSLRCLSDALGQTLQLVTHILITHLQGIKYYANIKPQVYSWAVSNRVVAY